MKVLVTGGSGALGKSLRLVFKDAIFPTHAEMDITNQDALNKTILNYRPDTLIHAAALVGIRECEENKKQAWMTNVEGTQNIVDISKESQ